MCRVDAIFECFASVDEDYGDFVVVLLLKLGIGVDVDFAPVEVIAGLELAKLILDDVAKVASFARVDDDLVHGAILEPCDERLRAGNCEARFVQWAHDRQVAVSASAVESAAAGVGVGFAAPHAEAVAG